jgi:TRAP-type C4-dicarboxylate transport system permease small subunit
VIAALDRFDAIVLRVEKAVVALMLALMGLVVFLDVAHRVSTRQESWLGSGIPLPFLGEGAFIPYLAFVAAVVAALALHTRGVSGPVWKGLVIAVVIGAGQRIFVWMLPNGLVWSQTFALALTLWLGTIGASLAAQQRRHLALDIGSKLWPPSLAPKVAAVGHVVTALFCAGIFFLAWRSLFGYTLDGQHVPGHYDLWRDSGHEAGNLAASDMPKWAAMAAIPYGMALLTFRFLLEAVKTWAGQIAVGGDDTLHQLGIEEESA